MNTATGISPDILKACDIRGIVGSQLNEQDAWLIGRSFGTILRRNGLSTCVAGYDGRLTSVTLTEALIRGLCESGIHVTGLGLVPTPLVYFALHHLEADGGIIVTASHNPAEYNGFKFLTRKGPFHGKDLQELAPLSRSRQFSEGEGSYRSLDLGKDYIAYLGSFLMPSDRELTVVWDPGNGAAAAVLEDFLSILPGTHTSICSEVDGRFPFHHPDPSLPENMEMLKAAVLEKGADLGIAFDGDGDRIGVVDGEGEIIPGDQLLVLYARDLLLKSPGAVIMSEVKASRFFYDDVRARGGIPLLWKVGHTHQKEKMAREDIPLAGETSGHIFFRENRGLDDALFASVKLLNILTAGAESLAEMRKKFPRFYDSGEIRLLLDAPERERVVTEIRERFDREGREYLALDGIRTELSDGFWMLRGSNTQPHITIRCESSTPVGLERCLKDMTRQLELSGIDTGQ